MATIASTFSDIFPSESIRIIASIILASLAKFSCLSGESEKEMENFDSSSPCGVSLPGGKKSSGISSTGGRVSMAGGSGTLLG